MDNRKIDSAEKQQDRTIKDDYTENQKVKNDFKMSKYFKSLKENIIDGAFIKNIFDEVVKSDDHTTEINSDIQKVIIDTLNEATKHPDLSKEKLEDIMDELIENSKSARDSKERDDSRKDEKIKMLMDWSKRGGAALVALILITLVKAGIDLKDVKDIIS